MQKHTDMMLLNLEIDAALDAILRRDRDRERCREESLRHQSNMQFIEDNQITWDDITKFYNEHCVGKGLFMNKVIKMMREHTEEQDKQETKQKEGK